jgi:hypothetical protein
MYKVLRGRGFPWSVAGERGPAVRRSTSGMITAQS